MGVYGDLIKYLLKGDYKVWDEELSGCWAVWS